MNKLNREREKEKKKCDCEGVTVFVCVPTIFGVRHYQISLLD